MSSEQAGMRRSADEAPGAAQDDGAARDAAGTERDLDRAGADGISAAVSQPAVASVIAGAASREQVHENVASGSGRLSSEDLAALKALEAFKLHPSATPVTG
jgi:aryl-alcohol dehydrogenase-like predicted oxidoreductase